MNDYTLSQKETALYGKFISLCHDKMSKNSDNRHGTGCNSCYGKDVAVYHGKQKSMGHNYFE